MVFTVSAQEKKELYLKLKNPKNGIEKIVSLQKLAEVYLLESESNTSATDSAFYFANQALGQSIKLKNQEYKLRSQILLAKSYSTKQEKRKAKDIALKVIEEAKKGNYYAIIGDAYLVLYNQLNFYEDLDEKTRYLELALDFYNKKSSKKQLANVLALASDHYNYLGDNVKAIQLGNKSLALYKTIPDVSLTNIYRIMGNNYYAAGQNEKAIEYLLQAARYGEQLNTEHELLSYIYNQLAAINYHLGNLELPTKYLYSALKHSKVTNDKQGIYTAVNNIVQNLIKVERYNEAEKLITSTSSQYPPENNVDIITVKLCYIAIYTKQKDYSKAQKICNELHTLVEKVSAELPEDFIYNINLNTCRFYLAKGDLTKAELYLNKNLKSIEKDKGFSRKKNTYYLAFQIDSTRGNYLKAIAYLNKVRTVEDSLYDLNKNKEIDRLQIEYETEKKDKDIQLKSQNIKLLGKEAELEKRKAKEAQKIRNIAFGVILMVLIFSIIMYRAYKSKQKTNDILEQQKIDITSKNTILSKLLEEKEWLLKEIHHRVKNNLQIVMSLLNSQSAFLKNNAAITAIKDSQRRVQAMSLIHQKLYQSDNLSSINMKSYVGELVHYLKDSFDEGTINFKLQIDDVALDVSQMVPIGLILNEAITNSMKYAFPGKNQGIINVSLKKLEEENYELLIADDGIGIDINLQRSDSLGMSLIEGLSNDLNGTLAIYNENGTKIKIVFKCVLQKNKSDV